MCYIEAGIGFTILINCSSSDILLLALEVNGGWQRVTCQNFSIKKIRWRNVSVLVIGKERQRKEENGR